MRFSTTVAFTVLAAAFVPAFTAPVRNLYFNDTERDVSVPAGLSGETVNTPE